MPKNDNADVNGASGQQTPIVVVAVEGDLDRYLVIDGYQRIAAPQQLGASLRARSF
jgi:ParB-like chromosome segregation protein Spo0J